MDAVSKFYVAANVVVAVLFVVNCPPMATRDPRTMRSLLVWWPVVNTLAYALLRARRSGALSARRWLALL